MGGLDPRLYFWRWRVSPGSPRACAFAVLIVAIAALLRWVIGQNGTDGPVFVTFYPAVLFATLLGGLWAGLVAALLSALVGWWAIMPPHFTFFPLSEGREARLVAFVIAALVIVWGAESYRRVAERLKQEEGFRKLAVEELAHRLKNKVSTIQSIVSFQLRDNPTIRDAINGRLFALSNTDNLILETQGRGAHLRDILAAELSPYDQSRVSIHGPPVRLPPRLAMTMAMVFHELATNAAKYGAFSSPSGQLAVSWSVLEDRLNLVWRESGGPAVVTSTRTGFGMRFLGQALQQFAGAVESNFEPSGLVCTLGISVPPIEDFGSSIKRNEEMREPVDSQKAPAV